MMLLLQLQPTMYNQMLINGSNWTRYILGWLANGVFKQTVFSTHMKKIIIQATKAMSKVSKPDMIQ